MQNREAFLALGMSLALILTLVGCGADDSTKPTLTVEEPLATEVTLRISLPAQAPHGVTISRVTVTVTAGPDDPSILATAPLTITDNVATGKVTVLAGKNRVFTLKVFDENGTEIGDGAATADVEVGKTVTVDIDVNIEPPTGEVIVNGNIPSTDADIILGEEIGGIKLGQSFRVMKRDIGDPAVVQEMLAIFDTPKGAIGVFFGDANRNNRIDDDEPVILLIVIAPYAGKTAGGNGIGSTIASVEGELGKPKRIRNDVADNEEHHEFPDKGINVTFDANTKRVTAISIYPAGVLAAPSVNLKLF